MGNAADNQRFPWGDAANLTILLHGMCDTGNLQYMKTLADSWRRKLPGVQVGFAASQIDINLIASERPFWKTHDLVTLEARRKKLRDQLETVYDFVVEAPAEDLLPPLKFDDKPNNSNRMIKSVQVGLAAVKTDWVLRIRSDAFIQHLDQFIASFTDFETHVGKPKCFEKPIAVAPYYTINPLLLERMSFHISDWYNLGLTRDIKRYWDVETISFLDAVYFECLSHAKHSNIHEKAMRARMPPEMHIATRFAQQHGYRVPSYFNELGFERDGLQFIRENFIMPDPRKIGLGMGKYRNAQKWILTSYLIISPNEWRFLLIRGVDAFVSRMRRKQGLLWIKTKIGAVRQKKPSGFRLMRTIAWVLK